jgi:N utilization substance protein B
MNRRKSREFALKVLYYIDVTGTDYSNAERDVIEMEDDETVLISEFASFLIKGVMDHVIEIDSIIEKYSIAWSLNRMSVIDRSLLRLSIFEIGYSDDIPTSVSINEAVDLAHKFSTLDSGKFINGILGNYVRENKPSIELPER